MSILAIDKATCRATDVRLNGDTLMVDLAVGRSVSLPLTWYPRLLQGTPEERANHRFIGEGEGIHWPDLDEDVSVENILAGRVSGEGAKSFARWLAGRASHSQGSLKAAHVQIREIKSESEPGLKSRHRDKSGKIQQKRTDTLNKNLPKPIPQFSPNAKVGTMRKETGKTGLEAIRKATKTG